MEQRSLYDRLGGQAAIVAVIEDFVGRCAGDSRINPKFARTDVPRLKAMLIEQVNSATGGVEVETPATGTPIPENYKNAPALARA